MRGRRYPAELKAKAIALRQRGQSLREIWQALQIPKITVQSWIQHVKLTDAQRARLKAKAIASAARGRPLAVLAWQKKIETWKQGIRAQVDHLGSLPFDEPSVGQLACGLLYICEGGKYPTSRYLSFGNTDPRMINLFLTLLRSYFSINEKKFRIQVLHRWDQDGEALGRFWSQITDIPLTQFYRPRADRRTKGQPTQRTDYRGICHLHYFSTTLQYQLQAIGESVLNLAVEKRDRTTVERSMSNVVREPPPPRYRTRAFVMFPEREQTVCVDLSDFNPEWQEAQKHCGAGGA